MTPRAIANATPVSAPPNAVETTGLVFHVMRYALHDGPGIRTTVFLKGCPLTCEWCHNPEGQSFTPDVLWTEERCRHCGACARACPQDETIWAQGDPRNGEHCLHCGACVEACTAEARTLAGRRMTVRELLTEVESDLLFHEESGGGLTLSGGEPCSQPAFTRAILDDCRQRGIHTALETCGFAQQDVLLDLATRANLVLYDVKMIDAERHRRYTGVDNEQILANLRALVERRVRVFVRIPFVAGLNDRDEDLDDFARVLTPMRIERIDALPYHRTGMDKYTRLGMPFALAQRASMSDEDLAYIIGALRAKGLQVHAGG